MKHPLKLLRYNTGTDKKAFVLFKNVFDAVIFNATIVAYSGASVADLVSMHSRRYVIDPQTHIFQQEVTAYVTENKRTHLKGVKKSVEKYLKEMPQNLSDHILSTYQKPSQCLVEENLEELVKCVYKFQTRYVEKFIKTKEYDKYLEFAKLGPKPACVIAPYFMLKNDDPFNIQNTWLEYNQRCLISTIELNQQEDNEEVAAQLVVEKETLSDAVLDRIKELYNIPGYEYIFIWVDDFNAFEAKQEQNEQFAKLLKLLNAIGKKPVMAYGGYESIMLCNKTSPARLYGVAQSVGYGEYRPITPVGGGMPVNKYYFLPLHYRMRFDEAAKVLSNHGYFNDLKTDSEHAQDYYQNICNCKQCREIIRENIHNFTIYNDSIPFIVKTRNGPISKNRPTPDASLIASIHFLHCKVDEWEYVKEADFQEIMNNLKDCYNQYLPGATGRIERWCEVYGK